MYYIYILRSEKDDGFYIGFTNSPEHRLVEHQNGLVDSTRHRRPVKMIYLEGYIEEKMARQREMKLKDFGSSYVGLLKRLGYK